LLLEARHENHSEVWQGLASLARNREQKTRAVAAGMGIPPGSAAITLDAAKESLLKHMPDSRRCARTAADLWNAALIPSLQTGKVAIRELFSAGEIQRTGEGAVGNPHRYFAEAAKRETAKDKNKILLQTLRGEKPGEEK
jgi:hypothetical protein